MYIYIDNHTCINKQTQLSDRYLYSYAYLHTHLYI